MTGTPGSAAPDQGGRRRIAAAVAAVAAVVIALVAFMVLGDDEPDDDAPSAGASESASSTADAEGSRGSGDPTAGGTASGRPTGGASGAAEPTELAPTPTAEPKPVRRPLGGEADLGSGISVQVESIEAVKGRARGIGEVAGPAIRTTVRVTNDGDRPLDMDLGLVNVYYGRARTPAGTLSGPGVRPFPAELESGDSASARLVFAVPPRSRDNVRIEFTYSVEAPMAVFEGAVSDV